VVQAACEWLGTQKNTPTRVIILPVGRINPVGKKSSATADFSHRLALCELAFASLPLPCPVQVLDTEWQRIQAGSRCNTTWDSLKMLENTLLWQEEVTFLLSDDHFSGKNPAFFRWHRWNDLLPRANWLLAQRPGHEMTPETWNTLESIIQASGHWLERLHWPSPDISSSRLRQWLATGRPEDSKKAEPFLPETVSAYIKKFGLYADKPD